MSDNENSACWVAFFTVPMPVPLSCRSSLTLNAFRSVFVGFIRSGPTPPNPLPRPPGLPPDPFQFSREVCGSAVSELIVCEFREDHFPTSPQRRVSVHNSYLPLHRDASVSTTVTFPSTETRQCPQQLPSSPPWIHRVSCRSSSS